MKPAENGSMQGRRSRVSLQGMQAVRHVFRAAPARPLFLLQKVETL